VCGFRGK
jgi:hypothetical protein